MKANTSALMRKGYTTGVLSGMTWGLDTVLNVVDGKVTFKGVAEAWNLPFEPIEL